MVNRNDAHEDTLLQQVIERLRQQEIPEFPDPEILASRSTAVVSLPHHATPFFWRLIMNRRFQLSAGGILGAAVLVGFLLFWGGITAKSVSAMEQMAENIRKAKSFKATMVSELCFPSRTGESPAKEKITGTIYYLAPGSVRVDRKSRVEFNEAAHSNLKKQAKLDKAPLPQPHPDSNVEKGPSPAEEDGIQIDFAGKPGISIDNKAKSFVRQPPQQDVNRFTDMIEKLGQFAGEANRELGIKEIDGKKALGFEIDGKKIGYGDVFDTLEVWIDVESKRLTSLRASPYNPQIPQTVWLKDFQWDIALDPKVFDTTPPEGYTDNTPQLPQPEPNLSLDEQVRRITEGLRLFANGPDTVVPMKATGEFFAGHYPKGISAPNVIHKLQWIDKSGRVQTSHFGLPEIAHILQTNPDAAYYGKTVSPKDKDKVLFRWKLDDSRYEVIFGDLRAETVTAERLHELEGKAR